MAFDFPSSPTVGQTYSVAGGPSYIWNGTVWVVSGTTTAPSNYNGFKNRIINGEMRISQRYGASVPTPSHGTYVLDRWKVANQIGSITAGRSTTAPNGFTNSFVATVTSSGSAGTNQWTGLWQVIEGQNIADLAWGTSAAQPISISFWVRSSQTGTYCVSLNNAAYNYSYVSSYTIGSANTWEYKTVTVPGPTAGTWANDISAGVNLTFGLNSSTTYGTSTLNTWASVSSLFLMSSQTNWCGTVGNTFYLTGVQLEAGANPTAFERRDIGQEIAMCQRYYMDFNDTYNGGILASGSMQNMRYNLTLPVEMRTSPTVSFPTSSAGFTPFSLGGAGAPRRVALEVSFSARSDFRPQVNVIADAEL